MMDVKDKIQINDKKCEDFVLGEILNRRTAFLEVAEYLDEECFYNTTNKKIWNAIHALSLKGENIDIITVTAELASKGESVSPLDVTIVAENLYNGNLTNLALRLRDLKNRRKLYILGLELQKSGVSEEEQITDIVNKLNVGITNMFGTAKSVATLGDACRGLIDIINKNLNSTGEITGTPTGFSAIDKKGGLQGSDLIIVAGETSNGKTAFALSLTKNAIEKGKKVAFYSLEMMKEQLTSRLVSQSSGIPSTKILYSSDLTSMELNAIDKAIGELPEDNLLFDDDSTSSVESILLSIRNMKIRYDIDGAIIDYLQILNVNSSNRNYSREQMMGDTARRLKNLSKELGIWIIALSQLSRNSSSPVPNLNRLRDSGQIAEAADVVILVYRPEIYNLTFPEPFVDIPDVRGKAMIDIAKGRNIGTSKFICNFNNQTTMFYDIDSVEDELSGEAFNSLSEDEAPF